MTKHEEPSRHTVSLPDHERADWLSPTNYPVIGLRVRGDDRDFPLDATAISYNVGASTACDISILNDSYISSIHCILVRRGANLAVIDKSKNGTYINNARCERGFLRDGAHLLVGKTSFVAYSKETRYRLTPLEYLCGEDPAFSKVRTAALSVAPTQTSVLVIGEAGTGKRTFAQAIHQESLRASAPFVMIDCDTLNENQIVDEVMGSDISVGGLSTAQGGTLVLHAVDRLPEKLRPRLVRALNGIAGEDIRIVATTSDATVATSSAYRWLTNSAVTLQLPALRDRWADIPRTNQPVSA